MRDKIQARITLLNAHLERLRQQFAATAGAIEELEALLKEEDEKKES